jgi:N-acetylmuramoyl-L-alanine amidase
VINLFSASYNLLKINLNLKLYGNATKLFLTLTAMLYFAFVKPTPSESKQIHVVIDASHRGSDFGAPLEGDNEKRIVKQTKLTTNI